MTAYPDTSFLCALYRSQHNTSEAVVYRAGMKEALAVTSLLLLEFRQSVRLQAFLHTKDASKGYGTKEAEKMLADVQSDIESGLIQMVPAEWPDVHSLAEQLSARHTATSGHRALDILHVATALHLKAKHLLTFDENQARLAKAEGLKVKP